VKTKGRAPAIWQLGAWSAQKTVYAVTDSSWTGVSGVPGFDVTAALLPVAAALREEGIRVTLTLLMMLPRSAAQSESLYSGK
jgi:hypothetical protein